MKSKSIIPRLLTGVAPLLMREERRRGVAIDGTEVEETCFVFDLKYLSIIKKGRDRIRGGVKV